MCKTRVEAVDSRLRELGYPDVPYAILHELETEVDRLRGVIRELRLEKADRIHGQDHMGNRDLVPDPRVFWDRFNAETDRLCGAAAEAARKEAGP